MAEVVITEQKKTRYAENLLPYESTLNLPLTVNVSSGGADGTPEIVNNAPKFNRLNSIRVIFTGTDVLTFDIGSALTFTAPQTGTYILSCEIYVPTYYDAFTVEGKIATFINSAGTDFNFATSDSGFVFGAWNTFTQTIQLTSGDLFECEIKIASDEIGVRAYLGGFSMVYDDRQMGLPPIYREPYNVISNSATLDFGSISSNDYADLTIALTGAKLGDAVQLGHPPLTNHYFFTAFISADNVVTVRCINSSGGSVDPASGTFNVKIAR
jgi:hypothetical protein